MVVCAVTPHYMPAVTAHVLLVEDNPDEAELTRLAVQRYSPGITVDHVSNGQEAVDYLLRKGAHAKRTSAQPALVLLDLKMPLLDGFGVLAQVKSQEQLRDTPVVVLTSSSEPSDLRRAYAQGTNAYVAKPTDYAEFVSAMKHVCEFWLRINRAAPAHSH
jgi:CheY-like chemotaxis protein